MEHPEYWTEKQREQVRKAWDACMPKFKNNTFGIPIIYGTAGEIPKNKTDATHGEDPDWFTVKKNEV